MASSWLSRTAEFWNEWGLRIAVLSSLASHVALVFLAGTRRRNRSLWGWLLLWPAFQIADISATYALGNLSLGGAGASSSAGSSCEQQLVAFWAPFLLLHLGRPDNMSAYALEDNTLSLRQALEVALQVAGASYVLYTYIYLGHAGALLPASAIMFAAGVAKYVERAVALRRGNLEHMRGSSSTKKKMKRVVVISSWSRRPSTIMRSYVPVLRWEGDGGSLTTNRLCGSPTACFPSASVPWSTLP